MVVSSFASRAQELVRGRRTLCGAILGVAFGVNSLPFYTAGLFMNALNHDRGWSLSDLSMGPTLLVLVLALSAPVMGQAFDRYGERSTGGFHKRASSPHIRGPVLRRHRIK